MDLNEPHLMSADLLYKISEVFRWVLEIQNVFGEGENADMSFAGKKFSFLQKTDIPGVLEQAH
jgi:hypothetical protein